MNLLRSSLFGLFGAAALLLFAPTVAHAADISKVEVFAGQYASSIDQARKREVLALVKQSSSVKEVKGFACSFRDEVKCSISPTDGEAVESMPTKEQSTALLLLLAAISGQDKNIFYSICAPTEREGVEGGFGCQIRYSEEIDVDKIPDGALVLKGTLKDG